MKTANNPATEVPPTMPIRFSRGAIGKRPVMTKLTRPTTSNNNMKIATAAARFFMVNISIPATTYKAPNMTPTAVKRALPEVVIPKKLCLNPVAISATPKTIMRADEAKITAGIVVLFLGGDMPRAILRKGDKN